MDRRGRMERGTRLVMRPRAVAGIVKRSVRFVWRKVGPRSSLRVWLFPDDNELSYDIPLMYEDGGGEVSGGCGREGE